MRHSAPAISVDLMPDPTWRRVALVLPALAALVGTWWLLNRLGAHQPADLADPALALPVALTLGCWLLALWAGWQLHHLSRRPGRDPGRALTRGADKTPATLCWDGSGWHIEPHDGSDPPFVDLQVTLDLGGWLLLRAHAATASSGRTTRRDVRWIALARRDHAAAWHGLRCALYSPRPPQPLTHDR